MTLTSKQQEAIEVLKCTAEQLSKMHSQCLHKLTSILGIDALDNEIQGVDINFDVNDNKPSINFEVRLDFTKGCKK